MWRSRVGSRPALAPSSLGRAAAGWSGDATPRPRRRSDFWTSVFPACSSPRSRGGLAVVGAALQRLPHPLADSSSSASAPARARAGRGALGLVGDSFFGFPSPRRRAPSPPSSRVRPRARDGSPTCTASCYRLRVSRARRRGHFPSSSSPPRIPAKRPLRLPGVLRTEFGSIALGSAFILAALRCFVSLAGRSTSAPRETSRLLGFPSRRTHYRPVRARNRCGASTAVAGHSLRRPRVPPHALRPWVGALSRHLLPASFLAGGAPRRGADMARGRSRPTRPAADADRVIGARTSSRLRGATTMRACSMGRPRRGARPHARPPTASPSSVDAG